MSISDITNSHSLIAWLVQLKLDKSLVYWARNQVKSIKLILKMFSRFYRPVYEYISPWHTAKWINGAFGEYEESKFYTWKSIHARRKGHQKLRTIFQMRKIWRAKIFIYKYFHITFKKSSYFECKLNSMLLLLIVIGQCFSNCQKPGSLFYLIPLFFSFFLNFSWNSILFHL